MTRLDLEHRATELTELMDDPDCDIDQLRRTYSQFRYVNAVVAGWRRVYRQRIRPLLSVDRVTTLLDVGCGGADVPRALVRWAARDRLRLQVTAIDPDERALGYATSLPALTGLTLRQAPTAELVAERQQFDVVVSNHLLHHLTVPDLRRLVADSELLARRLVVHNDIARSRLAYSAYALGSRPFGRRSFVAVDGLRSIRRSYRGEELAAMVQPPWQVVDQLPARLLLLRAMPAPQVVPAPDGTRDENCQTRLRRSTP